MATKSSEGTPERNKQKPPAPSGRPAQPAAGSGAPSPRRFYLLAPKDQRHNNWVLHTEDMKPSLKLRTRYAKLRCPNCGKVDEDAALADGIDPDVRIRSKSDYLSTDDGFICLSKRAVEVVKQHAIKGFRLIPLPGDPAYVIAMPGVLVVTDESEAGIQIDGPEACDPLAALGLGHMSDFPRKAAPDKRCVQCKRFFTTLFLPTLSSMALPEDPKVVFMSSLWSENCKGRDTWFHASDVVVSLFKAAKLTGLTTTIRTDRHPAGR